MIFDLIFTEQPRPRTAGCRGAAPGRGGRTPGGLFARGPLPRLLEFKIGGTRGVGVSFLELLPTCLPALCPANICKASNFFAKISFRRQKMKRRESSETRFRKFS